MNNLNRTNIHTKRIRTMNPKKIHTTIPKTKK